jgi:hypothetical protein
MMVPAERAAVASGPVIVCSDCNHRFEVSERSVARICPTCRGRRGSASRYKRTPKKYQHTEATDAVIRERYDGKVRNRTQAIARSLGWPKWQICKRAAELGLTRPWPAERRGWSNDEVKFLVVNAGSRPTGWMARRLGRTISSVVLKLKRMRISRAIKEGYTKSALSDCFGVDHKVLDGWAKAGQLKVTYREETKEGETWQITDAAVLRFIRDNPTGFRLDKVDQVWFLGLIRPGIDAAIRAVKGDD